LSSLRYFRELRTFFRDSCVRGLLPTLGSPNRRLLPANARREEGGTGELRPEAARAARRAAEPPHGSSQVRKGRRPQAAEFVPPRWRRRRELD
jgi:hypothetical protein